MTTASPRPSRSISNMATRVLTGIVLLPVILLATFSGGLPLMMLALVLVVLGALEFYHMERQRHLQSNAVVGVVVAVIVIVAFQWQNSLLYQGAFLGGALVIFGVELVRTRQPLASASRIFTTLGGVLYLAVPAGCLLVIRQIEPLGVNWMYGVLFSTWGTDTFAYLCGSAFGKTPLAPRLSPNKTREGALGGALGSVVIASLVLLQMEALSLATLALLVVAALVAIWGDLFESGLKRYFGVKDSTVPGLNIFPGHGGVLDRIDALLWVTLVYYGFLALSGQVGF